jgi:hypothetical protein
MFIPPVKQERRRNREDRARSVLCSAVFAEDALVNAIRPTITGPIIVYRSEEARERRSLRASLISLQAMIELGLLITILLLAMSRQ